MHDLQQFASSSNGDIWFIGKDEPSGETMVLHRANPASGGHETKTAIQSFLNLRPFGPERDALIAMLGIGDDLGDDAQDSYTSSSM